MRGTQRAWCQGAHGEGIIPAHAGNTTAFDGEAGMSKDHPRTCGEHWGRTYLDLPEGGSSPHMRGTHVVVFPKIAQLGIIPAHAGNTRAWCQ